MFVLVFYMEIN